ATLAFGFSTAASAAGWGPRTSTYDGKIRVEGGGTLTRLAGGSYSNLRAKDRMPGDGNNVYAYTSWYRIKEKCGSFGVNLWILSGSGSSCKITDSGMTHWSTPETTGEVIRHRTQGWCDQDGGNCASYGYKAVAAACAQMGWPVPNSCTYAYVEYHRP